MKDSKFRQIGQFQYAEEAFIYRGKIASEGIEVFVRDHLTINSDPLVSHAIGGVKLFVLQEDYADAMKIMSEINSFSVQETGQPILCPKCGEAKMQLINTIRDLKSLLAFLFSFVFLALPLFVRFKYRCEACGFEKEYKKNNTPKARLRKV